MSAGTRVKPGYLALFASLYALQGVVVAYFFNFNKGYMIAAGVKPEVAAWVQSIALIPLVLKFLAGPISDRFALFGLGHRRPYIALGVLFQSIGLFALASLNPSLQLIPFATMAVVAVAGLGLYDTCCDGMVVDITPPGDRSRVQAILWASRFLAAMVCTLGFGHWIDFLGGAGHADRVLLACAGLGSIPFVLTLLLPEAVRSDDAEAFHWSALRVLIRPWSLALLGFGGLYGLTSVGVESNLSPFYQSRGFGPGGDVGLLGSLRYLGRAAGALALPWALHHLGRRNVLTIGVVMLAGSIAGQAIVSDRWNAGAFGFLFGVANGWCDALFGVLAMEAADPGLAASTFALFMAATNLSIFGDALFATSVARFGRYGSAFGLAAIVSLMTLPLTIPLGRPAPRSEPSG